MKNPKNQILGINFHGWAYVPRSSFFLTDGGPKLQLKATILELKDVGGSFCERELKPCTSFVEGDIYMCVCVCVCVFVCVYSTIGIFLRRETLLEHLQLLGWSREVM